MEAHLCRIEKLSFDHSSCSFNVAPRTGLDTRRNTFRKCLFAHYRRSSASRSKRHLSLSGHPPGRLLAVTGDLVGGQRVQNTPAGSPSTRQRMTEYATMTVPTVDKPIITGR